MVILTGKLFIPSKTNESKAVSMTIVPFHKLRSQLSDHWLGTLKGFGAYAAFLIPLISIRSGLSTDHCFDLFQGLNQDTNYEKPLGTSWSLRMTGDRHCGQCEKKLCSAFKNFHSLCTSKHKKYRLLAYLITIHANQSRVLCFIFKGGTCYGLNWLYSARKIASVVCTNLQ